MTTLLKLKVLESHLQSLDGFEKPKVQLEQYETPPHIAAFALHTIQAQFEELEGCFVLDAGCGPGILGLGASLLGAGAVIAADIDRSPLETLLGNAETLGVTNVDVLQCDLLGPHEHRWENFFDTVLINPPFGTKNNAGIDMKFLQMGLKVSSNSVYSLHKSSTRSHITKKVKEWGVKGNVVAELRYDLPASYRFHKQQSRDIAVDLWRLQHPHSS